jgi:hypothetical protein
MVRPPYVPTEQDRRLVMTMIAGGIEYRFIIPCLAAPCSERTFRTKFRAEIATAKARADAAVIANLHRHAVGDGRDAVAAAKWWTQSRMGWKDTTAIEGDLGFDKLVAVLEQRRRKPDV